MSDAQQMPAPLTKEEREANVRWANDLLATPGQARDFWGHTAHEYLRYESTLQALESQGAPPATLPLVTDEDVDRAMRIFGLGVSHDHPDREAMRNVLRHFRATAIQAASRSPESQPPMRSLREFDERFFPETAKSADYDEPAPSPTEATNG